MRELTPIQPLSNARTAHLNALSVKIQQQISVINADQSMEPTTTYNTKQPYAQIHA